MFHNSILKSKNYKLSTLNWTLFMSLFSHAFCLLFYEAGLNHGGLTDPNSNSSRSASSVPKLQMCITTPRSKWALKQQTLPYHPFLQIICIIIQNNVQWKHGIENFHWLARMSFSLEFETMPCRWTRELLKTAIRFY